MTIFLSIFIYTHVCLAIWPVDRCWEPWSSRQRQTGRPAYLAVDSTRPLPHSAPRLSAAFTHHHNISNQLAHYNNRNLTNFINSSPVHSQPSINFTKIHLSHYVVHKHTDGGKNQGGHSLTWGKFKDFSGTFNYLFWPILAMMYHIRLCLSYHIL